MHAVPIETMKYLFALLISINLFPTIALSQEVNATPLKIVTVHRPPFTFIEDNKVTSGFTYELWQAIAQRIDRDYRFVPANSFSDMLEQVKNNQADLAAANISITAEREAYLDFSQPIYDSGLRILSRTEKNSLSVFALVWEAGVIQLIVGAAVILLIVAHLMWWFEGGGHPYFRKQYPAGVWDVFWWAFIIVTMGGFEKERPQRTLSRIFAIFWIIVGLFFISTFTAKITSALTVGKLTHSISSWRDLNNKKVGIAVNTTMEKFAKKNRIRYIPFDDFTQSVGALELKQVDAVIADAPVAEYYAYNRNQGDITVVGEVFAPDKIGIAFQQDSLLRETVDRALLQLIEDGSYALIKEKYFGQ